jgi:hypothetical protein
LRANCDSRFAMVNGELHELWSGSKDDGCHSLAIARFNGIYSYKEMRCGSGEI